MTGPDLIGDIWHFDKPEGVLVIEIVEVTETTVFYRTSWMPETVSAPRVVGPVLTKEWHRWRNKGRHIVARNATIEGPYRYSLARMWHRSRPVATFVMLNPSTADHLEDDPTVTRCMKWARSWSCGGLLVVNLFAFRATDPADLHQAHKAGTDVVGPRNDVCVRAAGLVATGSGGLVVVAWGAHAARYPSRVRQTRLNLTGASLMALDTTSDGHPVHPLARVKMTGLYPWRP